MSKYGHRPWILSLLEAFSGQNGSTEALGSALRACNSALRPLKRSKSTLFAFSEQAEVRGQVGKIQVGEPHLQMILYILCL